MLLFTISLVIVLPNVMAFDYNLFQEKMYDCAPKWGIGDNPLCLFNMTLNTRNKACFIDCVARGVDIILNNEFNEPVDYDMLSGYFKPEQMDQVISIHKTCLEINREMVVCDDIGNLYTCACKELHKMEWDQPCFPTVREE